MPASASPSGCLAAFALALVSLGVGCAHRPWEAPAEDWKRVTSDHFLVSTDADPGEYQPIVERLEDVHEALTARFFEGTQVARAEVLLFDRKSDFVGVAPKDVAGFFSPGAGTLREGLLVFSTDEDDFDIAASVAAHELAHKFLNARSRNVPAWLHEGFAKYVGAIQVSDERVIFDMNAIHGGYVYFADPVPLEKLLGADFRSFHTREGLAHYMTSWILMRQLLGNPRPDSPQRFRTMVDRIAAARSPAAVAEALLAAFDGTPLVTIDAQIKAFHSAVYHGIGMPPERRTLAVTVRQRPRGALTATPADRAAIRKLCQELRGHQGR